MEQSPVSLIEKNIAQRKRKKMLTMLGITVVWIILIWTTEVLQWLSHSSSSALLYPFLVTLGLLWVKEDAEKNEIALLNLLKSKDDEIQT